MENDKTLLTGPYVFYATGQPGYTLRTRLKEGRRGVVAADLLLNRLEELLGEQKLGESGQAFLFDQSGRIVGHPEVIEFTSAALSVCAVLHAVLRRRTWRCFRDCRLSIALAWIST